MSDLQFWALLSIVVAALGVVIVILFTHLREARDDREKYLGERNLAETNLDMWKDRYDKQHARTMLLRDEQRILLRALKRLALENPKLYHSNAVTKFIRVVEGDFASNGPREHEIREQAYQDLSQVFPIELESNHREAPE